MNGFGDPFYFMPSPLVTILFILSFFLPVKSDSGHSPHPKQICRLPGHQATRFLFLPHRERNARVRTFYGSAHYE
jgi:hypothetical protein